MLVFDTRGGEEEYSFFCSPQPGVAAATTAAGSFQSQGRKKRPPNKRERELARRRRELWKERRNHSLAFSNTAVSATTAACTAAAKAITAGSSYNSCRKVISSLYYGSSYFISSSYDSCSYTIYNSSSQDASSGTCFNSSICSHFRRSYSSRRCGDWKSSRCKSSCSNSSSFKGA
jgi:hypothetical protein